MIPAKAAIIEHAKSRFHAGAPNEMWTRVFQNIGSLKISTFVSVERPLE